MGQRQRPTDVFTGYYREMGAVASCGGSESRGQWSLIKRANQRVILLKSITPSWSTSEIAVCVNNPSSVTVCRMVVEATHSIIPRDEPAKYMLPDVVTEIVDEVLPDVDRGKPLLRVATKSGCNDYETIDYQNVAISRFRHNCRLPNPEIEGATTVTRKNLSCSNGEK